MRASWCIGAESPRIELADIDNIGNSYFFMQFGAVLADHGPDLPLDAVFTAVAKFSKHNRLYRAFEPNATLS